MKSTQSFLIFLTIALLLIIGFEAKMLWFKSETENLKNPTVSIANPTKDYKGTVSRIRQGAIAWKNGQTYAFMIHLVTAENKDTGLLLLERELARVKAYQSVNGKNQEIALSTIKKGDIIAMKEEYVIKEDQQRELQSLEIIKLN
jgi:hypothetical protein